MGVSKHEERQVRIRASLMHIRRRAILRDSASTSVRVIVVGFPHVVLGIKFEPELGDEIELGLEIIDVLFLVVHELLEQVAADVVLDRMTVGRGLLVERARRDRLEVLTPDD